MQKERLDGIYVRHYLHSTVITSPLIYSVVTISPMSYPSKLTLVLFVKLLYKGYYLLRNNENVKERLVEVKLYFVVVVAGHVFTSVKLNSALN